MEENTSLDSDAELDPFNETKPFEYDAPKFKDFSQVKYKTKRKLLESIINKNANALDKSLILN